MKTQTVIPTNEFVHPEQQADEILLINAAPNEEWDKNLPKWIKSIRYGKVAYTTGGKEIVPNFRPVFAILTQSQKV